MLLLINELDKMVTELAWKNILELHDSTLEFLIDEASWTIVNLKEGTDEVKNSKYFCEKARVLHYLLDRLCKKYKVLY